MELIDKSKLLEGLKRCEKICEDYTSSHKDAVSQGIANAKRAVCQHFIKFLDTLETKEVDLNREIEKEIETRWRGEYLFTTKFKESAKHFFELGMQQSKNDNNNEE